MMPPRPLPRCPPVHQGRPGGSTGVIVARVCDGGGMPSQAMQDLIEMLRKQQQASANQAPSALAGRRASFTPGGFPHSVPADVRPLASPLFASLAGLPPLPVLVGTADVLLSDSERLAAAATQAGVDVTLHVGDGLPHVYPIMLGTPEAAAATGQIGTFLRARVP